MTSGPIVASAIVAIALGCYAPKYRDCEIGCSAGAGCPANLTCDEPQGVCRLPGATGTCAAIGDAPNDTSTDAFACWSGVKPPTNFDPCASTFPPATVLAIDSTQIFNTDLGTYGGAAPGGKYVTDAMGDTVWLVHVASLDIAQRLRVIGSRPLLVVSDGPITISAVVDASIAASALAGVCDNAMGLGGTTGGGGGGGGNGGAAGSGGQSSVGATGGAGGGPHYTASLSPLFPGCPGGQGGTAMSGGVTVNGGTGGAGGGAVELVSAVSITTSGAGTITAGGGGGATGGQNGGQNIDAGGGGGGAGGAILLEAPAIAIGASTSVCAGGGGGGQGGSTRLAGGGGATGGCLASDGAGGNNGDPLSGGVGGAGSRSQATAGTSGGMGGAVQNNGGGGGGGGAGRIRLHASTMPTIAGSVVPAPAIQ